MNFGKAHKYMEYGQKVYRKGWNGTNMFISAQYPTELSKMTEPYYYMEKESSVDDNIRIPWVPSVADCFATDWCLKIDNERLVKHDGVYIICGFPGIGKRALQDEAIVNCCYSAGKRFDRENFPTNYINHIRTLISSKEYDVILVSSHEEVRSALRTSGIKYNVIYPHVDLKDEFMERYKQRGLSDAFIEMMDKNFESFIESCGDDKRGKAVTVECISPVTYLDRFFY